MKKNIVLSYAEYVLVTAAVISTLIGLFVLFPAHTKPPTNPYREGQSVLLPPEGYFAANVVNP